MSSTDSELLTDEQKREILLDNIKPLLIQKYSDVNLTYEVSWIILYFIILII